MPRRSAHCFVAVFCTILAAVAPAAQAVQEAYREVRIPVPTDGRLVERLAAVGVGLDHADEERTADGRALRTVLSAREVEALRASGLAFDVLVEDLAADYAARAALRAGGCPATPYPITGSMGCYPTLAEALAIIDQMRAQFPTLVSERTSIGTTSEGRPITLFELGDNPGVDEAEPEVLYTAIHHAREPQGLVTVLHFLWYLLENYGTDPQATYLLNNRRIFVVPVLNPDGYAYNQTTNPEGGGFWRKNRRVNGGGSFGVDLNRNYGFAWGYDNVGSSPSANSDLYRGPSAFSEPETAALRDFLQNGRSVRAAFNYHTYGDLLLYPWGYALPDETPDHPTFDRLGRALTAENGYTQGPGYSTIYPTNGESDDWMYGEQTTKPPIFAFTPEVGPSFWPDPSQILPLAEENLSANLILAQAAGPFVNSVSVYAEEDETGGNGYLDPGERGLVSVSLQNDGLDAAIGARARLVSTNPALTAPDGFSLPFSMAPGGNVALNPFTLVVSESSALGSTDGLAVEIELEGTIFTRPLGPITIGTPIAVFEDDASSLADWTTGTGGTAWGLTSVAYSPPTAFTDSPSGDYPANANTQLTLRTPLNLTGIDAPVLTFRARWDIEGGYDAVQVLASTNGTTYTPLAGRFTRPGSGQGQQLPAGTPVYDGQQAGWVSEEVSLAAYASAPQLFLRFRLRADGFQEGDGFFLDDVSVRTYVDGSPVGAEPIPGVAAVFGLSRVYPNPLHGSARIAFTLDTPATDARLVVFDALGRAVRTLVASAQRAGAHEVTWDGRDDAGRPVASGVYVVRLTAGAQTATQRVAVVR